MLQRVGGDLRSEGDGWNIENFALRAPGLTQVAFSGRLGAAPRGVAFDGATKVESADPQALIGWLADRRNGQAAAIGGGAAHQRCRARRRQDRLRSGAGGARPHEDRGPARLRLAGRRPARQAQCGAAGARIGSRSRAIARCWRASGSRSSGRAKGTLAIDIGRTTVGGVEAKDIAVQMRRDTARSRHRTLWPSAIWAEPSSRSAAASTRTNRRRAAPWLSTSTRAASTAWRRWPGNSQARPRTEFAASPAAPSRSRCIHACARSGCRRRSGGSTSAKIKLQGTAGVLRLDLQGDARWQPLGIRRSGAARLDQAPSERAHQCQLGRRAGRYARARSPHYGRAALGTACARAERAARWRLGGQRPLIAGGLDVSAERNPASRGQPRSDGPNRVAGRSRRCRCRCGPPPSSRPGPR